MIANSNHKATMLVLISVIMLPMTLFARVETYNVRFSESDFELSYNDNKELMIEAPMAAYRYGENGPCLPFFSTDIAISGDEAYVSSSAIVAKRLIMRNVKLAQAPIAIPTDSVLTTPSDLPASYPSAIYPASNCEYTSSSNWSDVAVLHFLSCPFVYDDIEKSLYFIDSMELSVELDERSAQTRAIGQQRNGADMEIVKSIVVNKEAVDSLSSGSAIFKQREAAKSDERIDYVIVTNEYLKESFGELMRWKKTKGLYSKIITIEEIESKYTGADTQVKIKKCLYDLYSNNSLKYALLGGDDTVVPVRGCYVFKDSDLYYNTCPADMYYSCFDGDFEWNANGNELYGEREDNIVLAQYINLTRVPVRTPSQAWAFISKLIGYEKDPKWSNSILMCGNQLDDYTEGDAEEKGNRLYNECIAPYWNGKRYRLFDTYTDFPGGPDYAFSRVNFMDQLSKGYSFVDVITHGSPKTWRLESDEFYSYNDGGVQSNDGYSIITTMACHTNAFDAYKDSEYNCQDPCVSESLIRNPSSGVVAYLGCSRSGFYSIFKKELGASLDYEAQYYKNLFSTGNDVMKEKSFGRLVNIAKAAMVGKCNINIYRWLQFGLNPIGDPEMPIFIDKPRSFDHVTVMSKGNNLVINAGVPGCRLCVMSRDDFGDSYYKVFEDVQAISRDDLPTHCSICVTKQGYIPRQIILKILQKESTTQTASYRYEYIVTGSAITTSKVQGPVEFNGKVSLTGSFIQINPNTSISKDCEFKIELK